MDRTKYYNNDPNYGWKLHLTFRPDMAPRVDDFLGSLKDAYGVEYKMGKNSGQTGKDATVYCGSKRNAKEVADLIYSYIGKFLLPPFGDVLKDDVFFNDKVAGRFTTGHNYVSPQMNYRSHGNEFHQYGGMGIPFLNKHLSEVVFGDKKKMDIEAWRKKSFEESDKLLKGDFGEYYTGRKKKFIKPKTKRKVCSCKRK